MFEAILKTLSNVVLGNEKTHAMLEGLAIRLATIEANAALQSELAARERHEAGLERLAAAEERAAAAAFRADAEARLARVEARAQAADPMRSTDQNPTLRTQRHPDSPDR